MTEPDKKPKFSFSQLKQTSVVCWRLLKIVWHVDPKLFTISVIVILIPAFTPFINLYITKLITNMVVNFVTTDTFNSVQFWSLIGISLITTFLTSAAFRTQNLVERLLWTKVPIELNQIIYKKTSNLDIQYFEDDKFRNLLEKVRESYNYRPQRVVDNLFFLLQSFVQLTIAFIAIVTLNWFFIILIVLVAVPQFLYETQRSKLAYGIWDAEAPLKKRHGYIAGLLHRHKEVQELKIYGLADRFLKEVKDLQIKFYNSNKNLAVKSYSAGLGFNGLSTLVLIGIEVYVIFEVLAKRLSIGDIAFYGGVVGNFQNGLGGFLRNMNEILDSSMYVATIFEVLDAEPIIKESENPKTLPESRKAPTIEFRDVSFAYPGSKTKILDHFNLIIESGEKAAFVGENGAGKSTIIKLLARFYDVSEGEILIDGINIKDLSIADWYKHVGVLFQEFTRYEDTTANNIYYGRIDDGYDLEKIVDASTSSGAHTMINKFEKGYEQMLGKMFENGMDLSGGQWQKIALSRAFFRNAPVLVLDEPTSAIDAKAESEIFGRVEKLSKDKTVIIISHRFSTVRNADKIYVVDHGKIKESGTHEELMKLGGQYSSLFKLQAKGYQ